MSRDGVLTPLYFAAQRINNDCLRPVGAQLPPLTSESVTHAGESTSPTGVEVFSGDSWVAATTGAPVVLGRFFERADQGKRWLLVVNRSFDAAATTTLTVAPSVGAAFEFDNTTGSYLPRRLEQTTRRTRLDVKLAAGAARLYRLHRD